MRKRELESGKTGKTEKRDRETFRWAVGEKSKGLLEWKSFFRAG